MVCLLRLKQSSVMPSGAVDGDSALALRSTSFFFFFAPGSIWRVTAWCVQVYQVFCIHVYVNICNPKAGGEASEGATLQLSLKLCVSPSGGQCWGQKSHSAALPDAVFHKLFLTAQTPARGTRITATATSGKRKMAAKHWLMPWVRSREGLWWMGVFDPGRGRSHSWVSSSWDRM